MTIIMLHLLSISLKIALLGGVVWLQLWLLRRAPASARSSLCAVALAAIVVLIAGESMAPHWLVKTPRIVIDVTAIQEVTTGKHQTSFATATMRIAGEVWLLGAFVMLLRAFAGRFTLARIHARSTRIASVSGVDVRLADVHTPVLSGLVRPAILLPLGAADWDADRRDMVATHELTHFRHGDVWTNLLAQILRAVFWFHPAVWMLIARLSQEQELTCDEAVVTAGHSRHDYAAFLLDAARGLKSADLLACSMAGSGAESLKTRFSALLDTQPRVAMTRRTAALIAVFGLTAGYLMFVRPVWAQAQEHVYKVGQDGVSAPRLLYKTDPKYTDEARDAKISGTVKLKITVTAEGIAKDIEVIQGLDSGLDLNAAEAVASWKFQPATKDGKPVPVMATIEVNFRLQ